MREQSMEWTDGRPPLDREGQYECYCNDGIDDYGTRFVVNVIDDSLPGQQEHYCVEFDEDGTFVPVHAWNDITRHREIAVATSEHE